MECDRTPACKGFSFDHWMGKCYMKDNVVVAVLDPRSTIAVKKSIQLPSVSKRAIRNRKNTQ
jgi:hypothetical protein